MPEEYNFDDLQTLELALTDYATECLQQSLKKYGQACLLVSGGRTPAGFYQRLSQQPLDWMRITVALVDERWVNETHEASNAAFIRQHLLQGPAAAAKFVGMKNSAPSATEGAKDCNDYYRQLPTPWALCLLGMGSDGHCASLFPHAQGLGEAIKPAAAVDTKGTALCRAIQAHASEVTGVYTERMSLTLAGLLKAEKIVLLISGEVKRQVYRQALAGSDPLAMPIRALLQSAPVDVYSCP